MDFVDFNLAKKLKEKGFGGLCLAYYTNDDTLYYNYSHKAGASYIDCFLSHNLMPKDSVSGKFVDAPTISQVLKWLRKEKSISIFVVLWYHGWYFEIQKFCKKEENEEGIHYYVDCVKQSSDYDSYDVSILKGIEFVLDNLI